MPSQSCYRILGVSSDATGDEIKQAYKSMALRWHPDRHPDDIELATRRFLEVQEAYQILMRKYYSWGSTPSLPVSQRTGSGSNYPYPTCFSASTSTLGSFIHVSASSIDSLAQPSSTIKNSAPSYKSYPSDSRSCRRNGPAVVCHPPQYSQDDHTRRAYSSTSPYANRSSESFRLPSTGRSGYNLPPLPKYSTTRDSHSFTIVPPLRKSHSPPPTASSWDSYHLHGHHQTISLRSLGIGPAKEWIYSLVLTFEELLQGKHCSFSLSRNLISGRSKNVILEVDIPPGCREGTRILCRGIGHERKDGTRQDMAFIIEEVAHDHFSRAKDDLFLNVKIPWDDSLRRKSAEFAVEGLDSQMHHFRIDYPQDRVLKGTSVIRSAGMPIGSGGRVTGRGDLFVQWEIVVPHHPKVFNFMKRFIHFRR